MLTIASAASGEFPGFEFQSVSRGAWIALAYLVVAGSIVAFTAYVWLIHHESPTKVGTYVYVNPLVAVAIGHFIGGEVVGSRTFLGTLVVLVSVIVITTTRKRWYAALHKCTKTAVLSATERIVRQISMGEAEVVTFRALETIQSE